MSFILDALRKSEHERQRQTGPGLAEVAVAPPRPRTNVWATAAIALLVVNLVAIGVLLLRKAQQEPAAGATPAAEQTPSGAVTTPATGTPPPVAAAPAPAPAPQATITQTVAEPPPMLRPAEVGPITPATRNPLEEEVSGYAPTLDPQMQAGAAAPPEGPPAVTARPSGGGSVVYETLPEAYPNGYSQYAVQTGASAGLPTADEFAGRVGLPELKLELHVYSNRPQERVAFINSRKYREGDTLAEGPQVEQITPDGVVLSLRGSKFLLPRE
jgi:general secretion pathway protein B